MLSLRIRWRAGTLMFSRTGTIASGTKMESVRLTLMFSRSGTIANGNKMENVTASPTSYFSWQPRQKRHKTSMKHIKQTYYMSAPFSSTHTQSEQHAFLLLYIVETAVHRFPL